MRHRKKIENATIYQIRIKIKEPPERDGSFVLRRANPRGRRKNYFLESFENASPNEFPKGSDERRGANPPPERGARGRP